MKKNKKSNQPTNELSQPTVENNQLIATTKISNHSNHTDTNTDSVDTEPNNEDHSDDLNFDPEASFYNKKGVRHLFNKEITSKTAESNTPALGIFSNHLNDDNDTPHNSTYFTIYTLMALCIVFGMSYSYFVEEQLANTEIGEDTDKIVGAFPFMVYEISDERSHLSSFWSILIAMPFVFGDFITNALLFHIKKEAESWSKNLPDGIARGTLRFIKNCFSSADNFFMKGIPTLAMALCFPALASANIVDIKKKLERIMGAWHWPITNVFWGFGTLFYVFLQGPETLKNMYFYFENKTYPPPPSTFKRLRQGDFVTPLQIWIEILAAMFIRELGMFYLGERIIDDKKALTYFEIVELINVWIAIFLARAPTLYRKYFGKEQEGEFLYVVTELQREHAKHKHMIDISTAKFLFNELKHVCSPIPLAQGFLFYVTGVSIANTFVDIDNLNSNWAVLLRVLAGAPTAMLGIYIYYAATKKTYLNKLAWGEFKHTEEARLLLIKSTAAEFKQNISEDMALSASGKVEQIKPVEESRESNVKVNIEKTAIKTSSLETTTIGLLQRFQQKKQEIVQEEKKQQEILQQVIVEDGIGEIKIKKVKEKIKISAAIAMAGFLAIVFVGLATGGRVFSGVPTMDQTLEKNGLANNTNPIEIILIAICINILTSVMNYEYYKGKVKDVLSSWFQDNPRESCTSLKHTLLYARERVSLPACCPPACLENDPSKQKLLK